MKKLYLETNAIARAVEYGVSGAGLRRRLGELGWEPATGMITILEFTKGISNPTHEGVIRAQFRVLNELDPAFVGFSESVVRQEIDTANGGGAVIPFLAGAELASTQVLVRTYANGDVDPVLQRRGECIDMHESGPLHSSMETMVGRAKRVRAAQPRAAAEAKDLDRAGELLGYTAEVILREILAPGEAPTRYRCALEQLDQLRHSRSKIRMVQRQCQIAMRHGDLPRPDRNRDPRHIADASYCDGLLSGDNNLLRTQLPIINPDLSAVHWGELGFSKPEERASGQRDGGPDPAGTS